MHALQMFGATWAPTTSQITSRLATRLRQLPYRYCGSIFWAPMPQQGDRSSQMTEIIIASPAMEDSGTYFPDEVVERILSFVDTEDLQLAGCTCRQWHSLVQHSKACWKDRLHPALIDAGNETADQSLLHLHLACHARNFLRNPTFSKALNWTSNPLGKAGRPWIIKSNTAVFENPPQGMGMNDEGVGCYPVSPKKYKSGKRLEKLLDRLVAPEHPGCIATSHEWAEVLQVVYFHDELVARGLSPSLANQVLDSGLPLAFTIMVAPHYACGGVFAVGMLLDGGEGPVPSMQKFVLTKPGNHHHFTGYKHVAPATGWQKFSYLIPSCPPGVRRALILLRGRQSSVPVTGQFGIKFASAELSFLSPQELKSFEETASSSRWELPRRPRPRVPDELGQ